jgi:hypothetical protein
MTILSENAFAGPFVPNGTTTVFPFNFGAVSPSEVSVFRLNAAGAQIAESGYTVHLLDVGGNVVYASAPPAGDPLYIVSNPNFEQQVNFLAQGNWSPTTKCSSGCRTVAFAPPSQSRTSLSFRR